MWLNHQAGYSWLEYQTLALLHTEVNCFWPYLHPNSSYQHQWGPKPSLRNPGFAGGWLLWRSLVLGSTYHPNCGLFVHCQCTTENPSWLCLLLPWYFATCKRASYPLEHLRMTPLKVPQNFEVFLVAVGAVASTWGCYSSPLSSLRRHPLLKFKPWHHFPPLKLRPQTRCRLTYCLWELKLQYNSSIPQRHHQQLVLSLQKPKSSSSRRRKWRRPLRLNPKQTTWFIFSKTLKFSFSDCKWLQLSQTTYSSMVERGGWIEGFAPISSQNFYICWVLLFKRCVLTFMAWLGKRNKREWNANERIYKPIFNLFKLRGIRENGTHRYINEFYWSCCNIFSSFFF